LGVLARVVSRFHLLLHAYCLMDNHFHLVVETPEANLSKAMRQLNCVYTQAFNRRHQRVGHVLQGRFKAILVDRNSYLLELCQYVVLNRGPRQKDSQGRHLSLVYLSRDCGSNTKAFLSDYRLAAVSI